MKFLDLLSWKKDVPEGDTTPKIPQAVSQVSGFNISLEVVDGTLLNLASKKEDDQPAPASENHYYKITVQPTGENPDYPAGNPVVLFYTVALTEKSGLTQGVKYIATGCRYTSFEVVEEYDDGQYDGHIRSPACVVWIRANHVTADGKTESSSVSGWTRPLTPHDCDMARQAKAFIPA